MELRLGPFVSEKTLVFTVTSDGYKFYTWNLYKMLESLRLPWKLCILCLDKESFDFMNKIAMIPSRLYLMPGQHIHHKDPVLFGSQQFKRMNRMKLKALEELSQRPEVDTLVYLDSDIAVFQDPLPAIRECFLKGPLWFQCDEKQDESLACSSSSSCPNPCTGVIAMNLTHETRPILKDIYRIVDEPWKESLTDQDYVLKRLQATQTPYQTLDRRQFPNGSFLKDNKYKEGNPVLLHFNYILGKDKKRFMKQKECWVLPEYG